jgi:hypothetical protein
MTPILSILALVGCDPYVRASYGYGYAQPSYGYAQTYQYQAPYQAQAYFQTDSGAYAAAVAQQVKKDLQAQQALQAQQDLAAKVAQLSQVVTQLASQPPPPPQPFQAPYQAPLPSPQQYQAPPVPEKSQPFSTPQVPTKQPAFGSSQTYDVPPPPVVNPAGADGFLPRMGLSYGGPAHDNSLASALAKCARCHTGADAKRGVKIWEAPGQLADLNLEEKQLLFDAVSKQRMPPRTPTVDVQARQALATSINADLSAIASTLGGAGR